MKRLSRTALMQKRRACGAVRQAGCDRARDDRPQGRVGSAAFRSGLRGQQPLAHGGDGSPAGCGGETGVRRFVAQSFCGWPHARVGGAVKSENDPLDPEPPQELRRTLDAIRYVEKMVTQASDVGGIVLRYGVFYGPDTGLFDGPFVEQVSRGACPSLAPATAGGRSCTSRMRLLRQRSPSTAARPETSTTSSMTNQQPCACGCRLLRPCWARDRRGMCRLGWVVSSRASILSS